jgi:primase-polymerase (primpol)-like protein
MTNFSKLPLSLIAVARWLLWILLTDELGAKPRKVPIDPNRLTAGNRPDNCNTFEFVVDTLANANPVILAEPPFELPPFAGIGFRFEYDTDAPFVFVDLDNCIDPTTNEIADWAEAIITRMDSYTEVSVSLRGIHIICRSTELPGPGNRKGDIEVYWRGRWAAMTGHHLPGTPTDVEDRTEELLAFHREVFGTTAQPPKQAQSTPRNVVALPDDELLRRARTARNGARFRQLFDELPTRPNHSEEDLELARMLAFWTGCDEARIDDMFRRSALMRDKWLRADYRDRTIARAIATCGDTFGTSRQTSPRPPKKEGS